MFKPCIVIPIFKHAKQFAKFADSLPKLPLILVDDGNSEPDKSHIKNTAEKLGAVLVRLDKNRGKNAAVTAGFLKASKLGFSHALQIDADGQHNSGDIKLFLKTAEKNPHSLINGCPVYDKSVPGSRFHGRKITNFWVMLETGTIKIRDAMCGFRVYPLEETLPILEKGIIFKRMGGDIELIVKAHWRGIDIINLDTKVIYPEDGFSNFRIFSDNVKISSLHAMLFLTMLKNRFLKFLRIEK